MDGLERFARSLAKLVLALAACLLAFAVFLALGVWQVHRLAWKEALIVRVDRNVHAAPVAPPGPARWAAITLQDEYRRMQASGRFDYTREVLVQASTELGAGYWVLTPLHTEEGIWLLVNRGFVPQDLYRQVSHGPDAQLVTGLLRLSEPGGRLFRRNNAPAGRWYSRDVLAIAAAQGQTIAVAPYFLDAVAPADGAPGWPRPGLTVLQFPNSHLAYALTWFGLAAMTAAGMVWIVLDARRGRLSGGTRRHPRPNGA
jgi:surfeit locus 1 family protein